MPCLPGASVRASKSLNLKRYVGASKVGFAGGGGFGGTAMRYFLSALHGYCFGSLEEGV